MISGHACLYAPSPLWHLVQESCYWVWSFYHLSIAVFDEHVSLTSGLSPWTSLPWVGASPTAPLVIHFCL